ncbi:MAG: hypothetical protein NT051_01090 [Candidatus Micrarchaeota archaeon]|nr:hypothetical protein [Candidatus Micrarchaeota archaeon]
MRKEIRRSILSGSAVAAPSEPDALRAMLLASISPGQTVIGNVPHTQAVLDMMHACRSLGADIVAEGSTVDIFAPEEPDYPREINCGNSIAPLRFLLPSSFLFGEGIRFSASKEFGMPSVAPFSEYIANACATKVQYFGKEGALPLAVQGPLSEEEIVYPALLGSRLLSGMLMFCPLLENDTMIGLEGALSGWSQVEKTVDMMRHSSVGVQVDDNMIFRIEGGQAYACPASIDVPSSLSESSYFLLAGVLCGKVEMKGAFDSSRLEALFSKFGVGIAKSKDGISASANLLTGAEIEASESPEFILHAMVLAAAANSKTTISGMIGLSRLQKSRSALLARELERMGAKITISDSGMVIEGGSLAGVELMPEDDAHVAMACSIAALAARTPSQMDDGCLAAGHPSFFRTLSSIGAIVRELA